MAPGDRTTDCGRCERPAEQLRDDFRASGLYHHIVLAAVGFGIGLLFVFQFAVTVAFQAIVDKHRPPGANYEDLVDLPPEGEAVRRRLLLLGAALGALIFVLIGTVWLTAVEWEWTPLLIGMGAGSGTMLAAYGAARAGVIKRRGSSFDLPESSRLEEDEAPEDRKKGRSGESWEDATKNAVAQLTRPGAYRVVSLQVEVVVNSPGVLYEYVVEVEP